MSTNMDVDPPLRGISVEIHPLAIVHMSDQYTRITCGGTPLPKDAPVVGLLFGLCSDLAIEILDADDIPTDTTSELTKTQIMLHQAVFPQHQVLGWYRVSSDPEPTAADLTTTRNLQTYMGAPQIFCSCKSDATSDDMLTLYEEEGGVLVGLEGWKLETSQVEQIAVERVVREQPPSQTSAFCGQTESVQESLEKMKDRVKILISFLEDTQSEKIPLHHGLLRHVQGLVCQLGCLMGATPNYEAPEFMKHVAVVTKAVHTVQGYTEKCKLLQDAKTSSRERRF